MPVEPVIAQGFGWTAAGAWASFFVLLGILVRQIVPWRKQRLDADQRLRTDLLSRVEKLEKTRTNAEFLNSMSSM